MSSAIPSVSDEPLNNIHVFMVSFPGQGHVNPLLRLGKMLASLGMFVTFSTTEHMGQSIRHANNITASEPTPVGRGMIRFEFFEDGWDLNDPSSSLESYVAHLEVVGRVKLRAMIQKHEEAARPVKCLINNPFIPWVTDVAENLGIPSAMLWVQSCACFSAYYHFYHKLVPFPSEKEPQIDLKLPCMPLMKYDEVPSFLYPTTPYSVLAKAILGQFRNLSKTFCVLMETFDEFESEIIDYMSKICCPVKPIGPLFKSSVTSPKSNEIKVDLFESENCKDWLDTKPEGTVVYISFGTVVQLNQEQIEEIAYGLLASRVSFLWVLRPSQKGENSHVLPAGFLEEAEERGKVVQWCPQEAVLAHPSISCFMTHCGWNSTMEAVASGVPVVAFPQWGDQVTNAKFLVDVYKVGIRMCRGEAEGRIVRREEVEKCLRAATSGPQVAEMKINALRWKEAANEAVAEGGSSDRNLRAFVEEIVQIR